MSSAASDNFTSTDFPQKPPINISPDMIKPSDSDFDEMYNSFCDWNSKYLQHISEKLKAMTKPNQDAEETLKNLRVLIIIGSDLSSQDLDEKNFPSFKLIKSKAEYTNARMLYYIFRRIYSLPPEFIALTSIQEKYFSSTGDKSAISPDSSPESKKQSKQTSNSIPTKPEQIDVSYRDYFYSQVGTKEFFFYDPAKTFELIKPFNKKTLETLKTNENTELLEEVVVTAYGSGQKKASIKNTREIKIESRMPIPMIFSMVWVSFFPQYCAASIMIPEEIPV